MVIARRLMKIQKNLLWLMEYLEIAKIKIPRVKDITLVRELHHQKNKVQRIQGSLSLDFLFGKYTLSLHTSYKKVMNLRGTPLVKISPYSKIDILSTLAHELAHLKHWEHTPQHKMLEAKLSVLFMRHLLKSGYSSEENELRGLTCKKNKR
jgi:hypothetical protein